MITNVLKEVMLEKIIFEGDHIRLDFYDAQTGVDVGSAICEGALLFNYSSILWGSEGSLPYFVLDVTCERLSRFETHKYLKENKYSYSQRGKPNIPTQLYYSLFKIQGGGIDIAIVCQKFRYVE